MAQVEINLLTKEFRNHGVSDNGLRLLIFVVVLGLVALGGWQVFDLYRLTGAQSSYQAELNTLQQKAAKVQQTIAQADNVNAMSNVLKNVRSSGTQINQVLASIQNMTPAGINIKNLTLKDGQIDMQVEARAMTDVETFHDSLASVQGFSSVQLKSLAQDLGKPVQASLSLTYAKGGLK